MTGFVARAREACAEGSLAALKEMLIEEARQTETLAQR
jgi:hypothetical protein